MANIFNNKSNTLVSGSNRNDTISNFKGNYVTINGGAGSDFIENYKGDYLTINSGIGSDTIENCFGIYSTINGGNGDDHIENYGRCASISSGAGNDTIIAYSGLGSTLSGGAGNDFIYSYDQWNVISGGAGDDRIVISAYSAYGNPVKYAKGDGNDTIYGFNSDDKLCITKGSYKVKTSGNDVIVTVGKGKITLKDAVGEEISIVNSKGKVTTKTYGSSSSQTAELFAENNFATADNLSAIVKNDLTATDYKIDTQNFENLMQKNNLITFADK